MVVTPHRKRTASRRTLEQSLRERDRRGNAVQSLLLHSHTRIFGYIVMVRILRRSAICRNNRHNKHNNIFNDSG